MFTRVKEIVPGSLSYFHRSITTFILVFIESVYAMMFTLESHMAERWMILNTF